MYCLRSGSKGLALFQSLLQNQHTTSEQLFKAIKKLSPTAAYYYLAEFANPESLLCPLNTSDACKPYPFPVRKGAPPL